MTQVVCVGQLMMDVVARLPGPLAIGSDTPAPVTVHGGGAAANVATWVVAAGGTATFVGCVGADEYGRTLVAELDAAGVRTSVVLDPARATGTCIVLVDPGGERTMIPHVGANAGLSETVGTTDSALDVVLPATADWLYLSGYALLEAGSREFALATLRHARARNWTVALDAASAAPLAAAGDFLDWAGADLVLLANDDEARVLTGTTGPAAAQILGARTGAAIVKSGAAGAAWSDGVSVVSSPPAPAVVRDSTGAGDAFAAGFLTGRGDIADRLSAGAILAARAVAGVGARPTHPDSDRTD